MQQSVEVRDDVTLLNLVAERRDQAAFSELYSRYERLSFSLALNILGDARTAEEQVQEAMLRIWSKAGTFRGSDEHAPNVKAWMMKIVARECFKALRRQKRSVKEIHQEVERVSEVSHPDQSASAELAAALQAKLLELADTDRELIALHFGGGISQSELSKELSISQQTISYRISRIVKELRSSLAASGFAAAVPLSAEFLQSALTSGHAPPSGLYAAVKQRLNVARSIRARRPNAATAVGSKLLATGIVVLVLAATATFWYFSKSAPVQAPSPAAPPSAPPAATPAVVAPAVTPPPAAINNTKPIPSGFTFTFEKGFPAAKDMILAKGTCKWLPDQKAIQTDADAILFLVNKIMPADAVMLEVKADIAPGTTKCTYGAVLHKNGHILKILRQWREHNSQNGHMYDLKTYCVGNFLVEYADGRVVRILEFDENHDGAEIYMNVGNLVITYIDIGAYEMKKIPAELSDPEKMGKNLVRFDLLSPAEQKKMLDE
jgi:RNA polymerase sigma-70 factor (ECF subfamily)